MSDDDNGTGSAIKSSLIGMQKAADSVASTDQLDKRSIGLTVGSGLQTPYPTEKLAALQELNGTHAVSIAKKSKREVGYGFEIVPHENVDIEDASEEERKRVEDFWHGRDTLWKLGPRGTAVGTPTEIHENSRQDYHGIGWQALEVIYAGYDDEPAGMAYLPAKTVRIKKARDGDEFVDEQVAGHGFVQKRNGKTRFFAEAGDRQATDIDGNSDPTFVDKNTGDVYQSQEEMEAADGDPANELLFIPNLHPNTIYYGLPTWISEIQTMVADQEARRFNRERLSNDLILDYVVIVEGGTLTDESREEIRENIQGLRDGDKPGAMILEAEELADKGFDVDNNVKVRIEPAGHFGNEDMSFGDYRDQNEKDIAKVHSVPLQLLGNHDATNSNSEEAIREFTEDEIKPEQERYAERIYRVIHQQILDVNDWTINFVTKGAGNQLEEAEIAKKTVDSVGQALTVNQALDLFSLDARDDAIGEMLMSEIGMSQSPGEVLDQRLTDVEETAAADKAADRIALGAEADD